jgi:hypothetical protein
MKRLTVAGRLIITAIILGAIFLGYKYLGGKKALDQIAQDQAQTPQTEATTSEAEEAPATESSPENSEATTSKRQHLPTRLPHPLTANFAGVVELGASGFNSFIIKVDKEKRWNLEKSEFGNSLGY